MQEPRADVEVVGRPQRGHAAGHAHLGLPDAFEQRVFAGDERALQGGDDLLLRAGGRRGVGGGARVAASSGAERGLRIGFIIQARRRRLGAGSVRGAQRPADPACPEARSVHTRSPHSLASRSLAPGCTFARVRSPP